MAGTCACCAGAPGTAGRPLARGMAFFAALDRRPRADAEVVHAGSDDEHLRAEHRAAAGRALEDTAAVSARPTASSRASPRSPTSSRRSATATTSPKSHELYISLVPRKQRKVTQRELEDRVTEAAEGDPRRAHALPDAATATAAAVTSTSTSPAMTRSCTDAPPARWSSEMRTLPVLRDARINSDLPRPEILIRPRPGPGRAARRHGGEHQRDHPHRDPRRPGAEQRQVLPRRPPDADPREPHRGQPQGSGDAREPAGADRQRRQRCR